MSITVVSNSVAPETKNAALGDLADGKVADENKSASAKADETTEESDASDATDGDEKDAKESEESEDEGDESDAQDDKKKKNRRGGLQKRFHKLTSKLSAKEQEVEYWKNEALKTSKSNDRERETVPRETAKDGRPKEDDFNTHAEYVEALTDWKLDQKIQERDAKDKETKAKTEFETRVGSYRQKVESFKTEHDDFDEVMEDVDDIRMSVAVQELLLEAENGPELAYELAKDPDEFARICALSPLAAAREFGKFEAKIAKSSDGKKTKESKTTRAPAPISPVGSKSSSSGKKSIDDPNLTQAEYEALRREQMVRKRA